MKKSAFTLAEVLIALALLGVIAAFTVPKILQAQGEEKKQAMMREGVAIVSEIFSDIYAQHASTLTMSSFQQEFDSRLSYLRKATFALGGGGTQQNYFLSNGAFLIDSHQSPTTKIEDFVFDYNGTAPPNQLFQDRIYFWGNWGSTISPCGLKPGQVGVMDPAICPTISGSPFPTADYRNFFLQIMTE